MVGTAVDEKVDRWVVRWVVVRAAQSVKPKAEEWVLQSVASDVA